MESADWERFQTALLELGQKADFEILGFELMSNHAHILIRCRSTPIGLILKGFLTSHSLYMNKKYGLDGHLFKARFKMEACPSDEVLKWQLRYIHRNAVRAGMVASPEEWPWSSHRAYCGTEMPGISVDFILSLFSPDRARAVELYREFVMAPDAGRPEAEGSDLLRLSCAMERERGFQKGVIPGRRGSEPVCRLRASFILRAGANHSPQKIARFLNRSETYVRRVLRREHAPA